MTDRNQKLPEGWDEERLQKVLAHYEGQTEEEAAAEDEAAYEAGDYCMVQVPRELVPEVSKLVSRFEKRVHRRRRASTP